MLKRLLFLGSLVLTPVAVMGNVQTADPADTVAYSVQPGQGNALTIVLPAPVAQPPYALTGESGTRQMRLESVTYGQSGPIMVYLGR